LGGELGFVVAVHANVSVSFSGIIESFISYGDKRGGGGYGLGVSASVGTGA
jgi:hypothetical protein